MPAASDYDEICEFNTGALTLIEGFAQGIRPSARIGSVEERNTCRRVVGKTVREKPGQDYRRRQYGWATCIDAPFRMASLVAGLRGRGVAEPPPANRHGAVP